VLASLYFECAELVKVGDSQERNGFKDLQMTCHTAIGIRLIYSPKITGAF
jgi:hypothetical protein